MVEDISLKENSISFIDEEIFLKTENGFEEAILYMSIDDIKYFDIETSVHICLKKDWERIQEVGKIRRFPNYQVRPVKYSMEYVESMLTWED